MVLDLTRRRVYVGMHRKKKKTFLGKIRKLMIILAAAYTHDIML